MQRPPTPAPASTGRVGHARAATRAVTVDGATRMHDAATDEPRGRGERIVPGDPEGP